MKTGVVFPQTEFGSDPAALRDYAQTAEGLGYDYFLVYDHVLGANPDRPGGWRGPYTYENPFHEPFVLFGYLAGLTETLEFTTGVLIAPQRQTALIAKQAAEVDVLSNGRLRLGVGIGWNKVEYDGLGQDFHTRGKRIEEQILLLRALWTKPLVTFDGDYDSIPDAGLLPLPIQRPIPIWMGGTVDAVLRRAARLADGWFPQGDPEHNRESIAKLQSYLAENYRATADFGIDVRLSLARTPEAEWDTWIADWQSLGATHLAVNTMGMGLDSPQAHIDAITQFKQHVDNRN